MILLSKVIMIGFAALVGFLLFFWLVSNGFLVQNAKNDSMSLYGLQEGL